mmetsp:Transcript_13323/g.23382  ORF Transcript_13323/g.23382 Transcript_13323/m.23382 type:complete len:408 (+) Transcript_13323:205-1428(+)
MRTCIQCIRKPQARQSGSFYLFRSVGRVVGHARLHELLVVGLEHLTELVGRGVEGSLVSPAVLGVQRGSSHSRQRKGHLEAEATVCAQLRGVDGAIEHAVDARAGRLDAHALAHAVGSAGPASVHEVHLGVVLQKLLLEQVGVLGGVEHHEGRAEASGEGGGGLGDAQLRASDLGGVAGQEMIHGLLGRKLGDRGQHAERIAGEEEHRLGVSAHGVGLEVRNVVDRVGDTAILGLGSVVEVNHLGLGVDHDVLQQRVASDGPEDFGFGGLRKVDRLGIAPTLEVEHTVVVPAVLVVTDELAVGVGGQCGLASAGEAEVQRGVSRLADVGGAVHGHGALQGEPVVHHREDTFLHLTTVVSASNDGELVLDVEPHEHLGVQAVFFPVGVGHSGRVDDGEIRLKVLQLLR